MIKEIASFTIFLNPISIFPNAQTKQMVEKTGNDQTTFALKKPELSFNQYRSLINDQLQFTSRVFNSKSSPNTDKRSTI